jgi:hypothetical protein
MKGGDLNPKPFLALKMNLLTYCDGTPMYMCVGTNVGTRVGRKGLKLSSNEN